MQKKTEKTFFFPDKIASQFVSLNCLFNEQDTFHQ